VGLPLHGCSARSCCTARWSQLCVVSCRPWPWQQRRWSCGDGSRPTEGVGLFRPVPKHQQVSQWSPDRRARQLMGHHVSDSRRCWSCFLARKAVMRAMSSWLGWLPFGWWAAQWFCGRPLFRAPSLLSREMPFVDEGGGSSQYSILFFAPCTRYASMRLATCSHESQ